MTSTELRNQFRQETEESCYGDNGEYNHNYIER